MTTSIFPSQNDRFKIFLHALLFVTGFSLVFIVGWDRSITVLGQLLGAYKRVISQIGGVIVILFGLVTLHAVTRGMLAVSVKTQIKNGVPNEILT